MKGWTDIYDKLPTVGSKIMIRMADTPNGESGYWAGIIDKVVGVPPFGEEWEVPIPNGTVGFVRYWRYVQ